jgi:hypothetical protein
MANNMILERLEGVKTRFIEVGELLTQPDILSDMKKYVKLNKEYKDLIPIVGSYESYKPNIAFYECNGSDGWISLEKTVRYIKDTYPGIFIIADAKRGMMRCVRWQRQNSMSSPLACLKWKRRSRC